MFFNSSSITSQNLEANNLECQKEMQALSTFRKICQIKLLKIDSLFVDIQRRDKNLTKKVLKKSINPSGQIFKLETSSSQLDTFVTNRIKESACKDELVIKSQIIENLRWLKYSEIKCDAYLSRIQCHIKKDSTLRVELGLELLPYKLLFHSGFKSKNKLDEFIVEFNVAKQLDYKINLLLKRLYLLNRSFDEIEEFKNRKNVA